MAKHTEVIARGLLRRRGAFLLCRNRAKGYCYLPGGHVEFGEGAREAVARELLEEAGIRVKVGRLIATSEASFRQGGKIRHEVNFVFHVEHAGEVVSREPEIEFVWVRASDVRRTDIRPAAAKRLLLGTSRQVRLDSDMLDA